MVDHTAHATSASSRDRIRSAARAEFASHGFAGARVDRIAEAAAINKERLYAHFGGKHDLFVDSVAAAIREIAENVNLDAQSIGDFAGRLFDFIGSHPETLRLLTWARLESDAFWDETHALLDAEFDPVRMLSAWQHAGEVDASWSPHDLFIAMLGLCEIWHVTPFVAMHGEPKSEQHRRALVVRFAESFALST